MELYSTKKGLSIYHFCTSLIWNNAILYFSLAPHWAAAATDIKEKTDGSVKLGALDATVHQATASKYGVSYWQIFKLIFFYLLRLNFFKVYRSVKFLMNTKRLSLEWCMEIWYSFRICSKYLRGKKKHKREKYLSRTGYFRTAIRQIWFFVQIRGYPTIKIFRQNHKSEDPIDYEGPRDTSGIVNKAMEFYDENIEPPTVSFMVLAVCLVMRYCNEKFNWCWRWYFMFYIFKYSQRFVLNCICHEEFECMELGCNFIYDGLETILINFSLFYLIINGTVWTINDPIVVS